MSLIAILLAQKHSPSRSIVSVMGSLSHLPARSANAGLGPIVLPLSGGFNASSGLTGGSAAVDQGQLLGQDMAKGTLAAKEAVTGDVAGLQAKDAATQQQMISLAESGSNIGNAAEMTAGQQSIGHEECIREPGARRRYVE